MPRLLERTPGDENIKFFPACLEWTLGGECHTFSRLSHCATGDESQVFLLSEELIVGDELNAASQGFSLKTEGNYSRTCFSKRKFMERSYGKNATYSPTFFVDCSRRPRSAEQPERVFETK